MSLILEYVRGVPLPSCVGFLSLLFDFVWYHEVWLLQRTDESPLEAFSCGTTHFESNDHLLISPGLSASSIHWKALTFDSSDSGTEVLNDLQKVHFLQTFAGGGAVVKSLKQLFQ